MRQIEPKMVASVSLNDAEMQKLKSSIDYIENDMTELGQVMDDVVDNGAAIQAAKNSHANNMIPQIRPEPQPVDSYRVKPDRNALDALNINPKINTQRTFDLESKSNLFSPKSHDKIRAAK